VLGIDLEAAIDFKVYLPSLEKWFWGEIHKISCVLPPPTNPFAPPKVLMGCPLWGDEFIARFTTLCLPTLMAPRNRAALAGRCQIVFFTDEASQKGLNYLARDMTQAGFPTTVHVIPQHIMDFNNGWEYERAKKQHEDLIDMFENEGTGSLEGIEEAHRHSLAVGSTLNKYWLLGVTQQILVWMAGKQGMGFHSLFPDHLYAEAYFENMWRIAAIEPNGGIAQTGISADIHTCLPELDQWRDKQVWLDEAETVRNPNHGSLVIPDRELGDLGFRHLHKQMRGNIMGKADLATSMPNSHYMFWVGKDKLHVNCCHMNAVWIPPSKTAKSPIKLYNAIDTMLPMFMPERVYIPDDQDGLGFLEISDNLKNESHPRVDFATYAACAWNQVHLSDDWNPFFEASCEIPIKEQAEYTEEAEIQRQHATICAWLKDAKPAVVEMLKAAQKKQEELIEARKTAVAQPAPALNRAMRRQMQAKRRNNGAEHHAGAA
jgi:hypothetical protein